ncbi:MarR family winged helix-turn-helix transcriptional regulator [Nocardia amikacinitolerans]|uniref:MarR family winged helix-turn-helix transcriptional regulator n=1 Tax=Nocardia amikacinitolerans TaxID=756689 RepID=UPI0020A5E7B6|nr:MarR family winged helix-turn-helix transcriptional regulator [Nocardia amikacinitolerans]
MRPMEERDASAEAVAAAMVRIRRRQTRGALAGESRVPPAVFRVLDAVSTLEDPTVGALAPALGVDQPRASRLVAQAVSEGWLERVADQRDGRRAVLRPTALGDRMLTEAHRRRAMATAAAMADWSERERAEFARLLGLFVDAMDAAEATPPGS